MFCRIYETAKRRLWAEDKRNVCYNCETEKRIAQRSHYRTAAAACVVSERRIATTRLRADAVPCKVGNAYVRRRARQHLPACARSEEKWMQFQVWKAGVVLIADGALRVGICQKI